MAAGTLLGVEMKPRKEKIYSDSGCLHNTFVWCLWNLIVNIWLWKLKVRKMILRVQISALFHFILFVNHPSVNKRIFNEAGLAWDAVAGESSVGPSAIVHCNQVNSDFFYDLFLFCPLLSWGKPCFHNFVINNYSSLNESFHKIFPAVAK